jgi:hypothetical protein
MGEELAQMSCRLQPTERQPDLNTEPEAPSAPATSRSARVSSLAGSGIRFLRAGAWRGRAMGNESQGETDRSTEE